MTDKKIELAKAFTVDEIQRLIKVENEAEMNRISHLAQTLLGDRGFDTSNPEVAAKLVEAFAAAPPAGNGGCGFCGCC